MKQYEIQLEISGPTAMWTRPDTGDAPVSYPAPTFGAAKGILESINWSQWADIIPTKVEICQPVVYHNYYTNYGGPMRKTKIMPKGNFQLIATVLVNVCYRIYARPTSRPAEYEKRGRAEQKRQATGTTNGAHAYQAIFNRRLRRGQCYYTPFLGWKEFVPDYVGPFRSETKVCTNIDVTIPSMLRTCFPQGKNSNWEPQFTQDMRIEKGVILYAE